MQYLELDIDNEIVKMALASLARISISSELTDLWKESDEFDAWRGAVKDLNDRLLLSVSAS